jgi:DNA-directed RNA polymerase subunit RPC12/RpoP
MSKYKCHNCGHEWVIKEGRPHESCIKCGTIFVERIKEV